MPSSLKHHFLTSLKRGLLNVLEFLSTCTFQVMVVIEGTVAFFFLPLSLSLS